MIKEIKYSEYDQNILALTGKYDAIIALGAVIKGDTSHNEYIANETAKGLALIALEQKIPVTFGVITCDTLEQALMRSGSKAGNKGAESALAALEAANVLKETRSLIEGCNK